MEEARLEQRLVVLASVRFVRDGYGAVSLSHVARDAGVKAAQVREHFASADDILLAAVDADIESVLAGLDYGYEADLDLATVAGQIVDAVEGRPLLSRVLDGTPPEFVAAIIELPAMARARERLVDALFAAQRRGGVRGSLDVPATALAIETVMMSLIAVGARWRHMRVDWADRRAAVTLLVTQALAASPTHWS